MKIRLLGLMLLLGVSLLLGGRTVPVLAQSANETPQINLLGGAATSGLSYSNVRVWVNPEYDDPRLLVMMQGQIAGATPPVLVKFLVPTGAEMYSAGSKDPQDKYIPPAGGRPYRNPSSIPGWDEISYELQTDIFRVEYYDSAAIAGYPDKKISYDFRTIYPLSNLSVVLQQPKNSTGFTADPKGAQGVDQEGFTIFTSSQSSLAANGALHWDIAYTRTDTNPAYKPPATNPPASNQQPSSAPGNSNNLGVILGGVAGVIVIGAAAVWIMKSGSQSGSSAPRSERRRALRQSGGGQPRPAKPSGEGGQTRQGGGKPGRFCTKCGAPAGANDKFCPSCGTKLREQG